MAALAYSLSGSANGHFNIFFLPSQELKCTFFYLDLETWEPVELGTPPDYERFSALEKIPNAVFLALAIKKLDEIEVPFFLISLFL